MNSLYMNVYIMYDNFFQLGHVQRVPGLQQLGVQRVPGALPLRLLHPHCPRSSANQSGSGFFFHRNALKESRTGNVKIKLVMEMETGSVLSFSPCLNVASRNLNHRKTDRWRC